MPSIGVKKFLVFYIAPGSVLAEWSRTDPEVRKAAELKMRTDWQRWMQDHAALLTLTEAAGKTKVVTTSGIADGRNDIMLYSVVEAESQERAAEAFADHPHLAIPQASIQVMEVRSMGPG